MSDSCQARQTDRPLITSGLTRKADELREACHFALGPEAELGARPRLPCFDLNPALPLPGFTAQF
jgi:hypothetical protein